MRIYTEEQLSDALANELAWRKVELSAMRRVIQKAEFRREPALCRGGIALVYAHWEGYVKDAGSLYLNFVVHQRLRYKELAPNFLAVAMRAKLDAAETTLKACLYTEVCDIFVARMEHRATIPYKDIIDTGSNLNSDVFRNVLCLLGLDTAPYKGRETPIIEELLKIRNRVAHGRWVALDSEIYEQFHTEVIDMLDTFRNQIEVAVNLGTFKRAVP